MIHLSKLQPGDKVAIVSPSFAAPGKFPAVYELGLQRLRDIFNLEPVEFPTTKKVGASTEDRAKDLIAAFENPEMKAVIATIGGNDQVTYIKNLPSDPFTKNPKPFFGYSDNTHFMNFLWLHGIPSYYGGSIMTQFAMQGEMDEYTIKHLKHAFFEDGEIELQSSKKFNDIGLNWDDEHNLLKRRVYEQNDGWQWSGSANAKGITWGGCLESIDKMFHYGIQIPSLEEFQNIILLTETSEDIPSHDYVSQIYKELGERGILERIKGILVGRPKAWEFNNQQTSEQRKEYREKQREAILKTVRMYNDKVPVVQNMDFGHTDPQIPIPYGRSVRIDVVVKKMFVEF